MAMMFILAMLTTLSVQAAADKTALNAAISEAKEAVTTGVRSLTPDPSPKGEGSSNWFTLAGRKVKTPSLGEGRGGLTPGVYINNGVVKVNK